MIIPVNFAQVNLIFTGASVPTGAEVTFGVDNQGSTLTATLIADTVDTAYSNSGIAAEIADDVDLTTILVKKGPNATGASASEPSGNPGTGGEQSSPNTAWLVRKETASGGRAGHGRFFLPGVPDGSMFANGQITSGHVTAMQLALDTFLLELEAQDIPMVVLHGAGSPISTPTLVTGLLCQTTAATQRRRLRR